MEQDCSGHSSRKAACSLSPFNKFAYSTRQRREFCLTAGEGLGYCEKGSQCEITQEEITRLTKVRWIILKYFKEDIMVLHKRSACPWSGT